MGVRRRRVRRLPRGPWVSFSQRWAEERHGERVKRLLREVIGLARAKRMCELLLVKVLFYRNPSATGTSSSTEVSTRESGSYPSLR